MGRVESCRWAVAGFELLRHASIRTIAVRGFQFPLIKSRKAGLSDHLLPEAFAACAHGAGVGPRQLLVPEFQAAYKEFIEAKYQLGQLDAWKRGHYYCKNFAFCDMQPFMEELS